MRRENHLEELEFVNDDKLKVKEKKIINPYFIRIYNRNIINIDYIAILKFCKIILIKIFKLCA